MNKETIGIITKLLNLEVNLKRDRMMDCINNGFDAYLKDRINDYREAFHARDDFREWVDEQDLEEGEEV